MNWDAIGAIGEIVGAFAVVVSLIYLALQIRQTREHAKLETELHLSNQSSQHTQQYALDPDLARIHELSITNPSSLTDDEKRRAMFWHMHWLFMVEGLYRRYGLGLLSSEVWKPYERTMAGMSKTEFFRSWWQTEMNLVYTDTFREYVDQVILKYPDAESWKLARADTLAGSEKEKT